MSEETPPIIIVAVENKENEVSGLRLKYKSSDAHGIQTLKCLDAMRKERQLCDVILMVEGHELFAHRALLSCHSNYFLELFLIDENETSSKKQMYYQIDGLDYASLKLIIQFIYRGSCTIASELVPKIYLAAHQLRIETIFKACSQYLCEQLTQHNCLSTRLLAIDDDLRTKANEFIENNFNAVVEAREFHFLPTIKLELIDGRTLKPKTIFDLSINWVAQQLSKENGDFQELYECVHLLYLNGETLHDCTDMDDKNIYFSDLIKNYQSYKLKKRNLSSSSTHSDIFSFEMPSIHINHHNLLKQTIISSHSPETKLIHIGPPNDHAYIAIAIIKGKMLILSIHMSTSSLSPTTSEHNGSTPVERIFDENHSNGNSPILTVDKETQYSPMLTPRCYFGITSVDHMIYVTGGYNRFDCLNTIEQFNSNENKWTLLPYSMISRRGRVSASIINDKIYVCGGSDGHQELNTAECFDLKSMGKWSMISELSTPVAHSAMCSDNNYVYLIGGMEGDKCKSDCYRYNPKDNTWSKLASMHFERCEAGIVYCNDKIYVFGGSTLSRCLSSCEILTLSTDKWSMGPSMKETRRGCGTVLYHDKIFVIGGSNGVTSLISIEIFNPATQEWLATLNGPQNELNIPRVGAGVTVCCDRIYAIGGFDGRTFLKSVEVYDEDAQKWRLTYNNTDHSDQSN